MIMISTKRYLRVWRSMHRANVRYGAHDQRVSTRGVSSTVPMLQPYDSTIKGIGVKACCLCVMGYLFAFVCVNTYTDISPLPYVHSQF